MDVAFHLTCHSGGIYEVVRTVGTGEAADRHSEAKAVSRATVLRSRSFDEANRALKLLRRVDVDSAGVE
jgi:hypothetical protein